MGACPALGCWDARKAFALKPVNYPLWKSDEIDVSDVGPPEEARPSGSKKLEYKYVIRSANGARWEHGSNRWVPVETCVRLTVHDGFFGHIQPQPFSFEEQEPEEPEHSKESPEGSRAAHSWRIVVIGSSVAEGYNTWRKRGWAWYLGEALHKQYGHRVINVSRSGANTGTTKERFREVVAPLRPDVVIIALSLGNEGLAHCRPGERRAAQHRYEQGLLDLISMTLALDAMPILGGVYPNNDFNAETYSMLKETARTMSRWDIPVLDWLGSLDDGRGRWKEGLWFDHAHPNTEGQRRMFECIDLALFESRGATERDIPVLVRRRSSLTQFDAAERQTSYSSLDQVLQASQQAEAHGSREAVGPPTFDDGRGFSVVLCRGAISIRNKTRHEYILSPEWKELTRALRTAGLRPGIYIANDDCCRNHRVLFVNAEGHLSRRLVLPPGADALYLPSFLPGTGGQDR